MATSLQAGRVQLRLHWGRAIGLVFVQLLTATALVIVVVLTCLGQCELKHVLVGLVSYAALGLGVTVYLHRYRTHGAFEFVGLRGKVLEILLNMFALAAFQSTAIRWAFWHQWHHHHSDRDDDFHSPLKNWLWAQGLWLLYAPEPDEAAKQELAQPDLMSKWMDTYLGMVILGPGLALGLAYLAAGWMGMVWYLAAACVAWHVTGCINSVCHKAPRSTGDAPNSDTGDYSRNVWWLVVPSLGEAWHHNHHRHQHSARFGPYGWLDDLGYMFIRVGRALRLVQMS